MRILVVEDESLVAQAIQALIVNHHYAVDIATDGLQGLEMADAYTYDLILLDIGLPQLDGISLCQQLRAKGIQTPILLLTGQVAAAHAKATALNAGADDYVTKPFDSEELLARIKSLLRRGDLKTPPILRWGMLWLDPNRLQVSYGETLLHLTPKEYSLLELLLRHAPNIISSNTILEQCWSALDLPSNEVIRTHLKELRKKLKAAGAPLDFIKTVHHKGYRLNPLYGEAMFSVQEESAAALQMAELKVVNEELRKTLEQLQARQVELQQKNQELQAARDKLEVLVVERTTELSQREAFWSSIYDGAAQSIFVVKVTETNDFRYVSFNRSAQESTGLSQPNVQNKTPEDVFGLETGSLFRQNYERCLQAGCSITYEDHFIFDERPVWTLTTLSPLRDTKGRIDRIVGTVLDISDRKLHEQQQEYLLKLSDALRPLSDAAEIEATACRLLGEHLGVDRAYYVEVNETEGYAYVSQNYLRGDSPSIVGTYSLEDFGWTVPLLRRGETIVVADTETTDIIPDRDRAAMAAIRMRSHISLPIIKAGILVGAVCVTESVPHQWTAIEIELVNETAERIWADVQRARAEADLRESELRRVREQAALEQERRRAESLAELDHVKTQFFSSISHEFRTPLTLILGLLEDVSKRVDEWESQERGEFLGTIFQPDDNAFQGSNPKTQNYISTLKHNFQLAHRNALRLLKLVNTLLDFSRIEANRLQASYQPTDLAVYTAELASVFRSTIEHANLQLVIDCPPLPEPIYVDREMWEKIVLNLISNAFKFTFAGEIQVSLRTEEWRSDEVMEQRHNGVDNSPPHPCTPSLPHAHIILEIRDTGIGIPAKDLPHLFERFYQVKSARGRSYEGSGIGLALVQELVKLHGGTIAVASTVGQGSCFTVTIPTGHAHLPSDQIQDAPLPAPTVSQAGAYLEEMQGWQPAATEDFPILSLDEEAIDPSTAVDSQHPHLPDVPVAESAPRILVVDDNADMQGYLQRLFSQRYTVDTVSNGLAALEAIAVQPPDLVVSDVMMPELDGLQFLRSLRNNPQTQDIPVIILSARAGEAAQIEGLISGADDYLIKPFSARELLARVDANLKLSRMRREVAAQAAAMQITQSLNERLEQQVAARTARLQNLNQELEAFAHVISHDLKTLCATSAALPSSCAPCWIPLLTMPVPLGLPYSISSCVRLPQRNS